MFKIAEELDEKSNKKINLYDSKFKKNIFNDKERAYNKKENKFHNNPKASFIKKVLFFDVDKEMSEDEVNKIYNFAVFFNSTFSNNKAEMFSFSEVYNKYGIDFLTKFFAENKNILIIIIYDIVNHQKMLEDKKLIDANQFWMFFDKIIELCKFYKKFPIDLLLKKGFRRYLSSVPENFKINNPADFIQNYKKIYKLNRENDSSEFLPVQINNMYDSAATISNKNYVEKFKTLVVFQSSDNEEIKNKFLSEMSKIIRKMEESELQLLFNNESYCNFMLFIYLLCNKDINFLSKMCKTPTKVTFHSNIYKEEFKLLLKEVFKTYLNIQESKAVALFNNLSDWSWAAHAAINNKKNEVITLLVKNNYKLDSQYKKLYVDFYCASNEDHEMFLYHLSKFSSEDFDKYSKITNYDLSLAKEDLKRYSNVVESNQVLNTNGQLFSLFYNVFLLISNYSKISSIEKQKYANKNLALFSLNLTLDNAKFRVLGDNDTEYFTVGIATNCCQKINGEGQNAVIDSYINPLSSVLILETLDKRILAQSYFHYVPQEKGFILDNVETNEDNIKKSGIKIELCYEQLANKLQSMGARYLKCGLSYNKLDKKYFEVKRNKHAEDPRIIMSEDVYTDFSPRIYLSLFKSKKR